MNYSKFLLLFSIHLAFNSLGFTQSKTLDVSHCIPALDTLDGQAVLQIVEKMPEFEGGLDKFYKSFGENIAISREAKRMGLCNKFFFTFVIDTLGQMRNFCAMKPNCFVIEPKFIEEINQKKLWKVGEHKGKKVYVRFNLPIFIRLSMD